MKKFKTITALAAALRMNNIDTDMIIPKQFLTTIKRSGLGRYLFYELRTHLDETPNQDFILNQKPWDRAEILITGKNFGCGSSREHALWALLDFGIQAVIAPSFADIFYMNALKNGILPISLPQEQIDKLMDDSQKGANARIIVDLVSQTITRPNGEVLSFEIDLYDKECLLNGIDDIDKTLKKHEAISAFEMKRQSHQSWI